MNRSLQLWFVEGRDYRSANDDPDGPQKSIWGKEQRDWLTGYSTVFDPMYVNHSELAARKRPLKPAPARALSSYVGSYSNDYFGMADISLKQGRLVMALGPVPYNFELTHWDGNVFSYLPRGENAVGISAVSFNPDKLAVTIENLDEHGLGTFLKQAAN